MSKCIETKPLNKTQRDILEERGLSAISTAATKARDAFGGNPLTDEMRALGNRNTPKGRQFLVELGLAVLDSNINISGDPSARDCSLSIRAYPRDIELLPIAKRIFRDPTPATRRWYAARSEVSAAERAAEDRLRDLLDEAAFGNCTYQKLLEQIQSISAGVAVAGLKRPNPARKPRKS